MGTEVRRVSAALAAVLILVALAAGILVGRFTLPTREVEPVKEPVIEEEPAEPAEEEARLLLRPAEFDELPGWRQGSTEGFLEAFRRSCAALERLPADRPMGTGAAEIGGTAGDWRAVCADARNLPGGEEEAVWSFVEERFVPFQVTDGGDAEGLFTGYYEPTLQGSRTRSSRYDVPLYVEPPDLVAVDLGEFRDDLQGRRIAGRIEDGALVPYPEREEIEEGALTGKDLELLWVDDPVDAFFLEIQGSGVVEMDDGTRVRVGYAAQNGHPYYAIGRELVARGAMEVSEVSMQSIRRWLEEHPDQASEVMRTNASYVFFRELRHEGPLGAQGVVLTPGRSLAVDRSFHPLSAPVWLDTTVPERERGEDDRPFRRLMVAQDTGGAIRGPVRGDVFWGPGDEAARRSGQMSQEGRLWILLPQEAARKVAEPYLAGGGLTPAPAGRWLRSLVAIKYYAYLLAMLATTKTTVDICRLETYNRRLLLDV